MDAFLPMTDRGALVGIVILADFINLIVEQLKDLAEPVGGRQALENRRQ